MESKLPPDQIFIFDDVITDEWCNDLIKIIKEEATQKDTWRPTNNVECYPLEVCDIADKEMSKKVDNMICKILNIVCEIFIKEYGLLCNHDCGYTLRKIVGPTRLHTDGLQDLEQHLDIGARQMSVIIALNDDYEGGEFIFPEQNNRKIKLKRGQLIAFPPYWTHPHKVEHLLNETCRYTINTWIHGR